MTNSEGHQVAVNTKLRTPRVKSAAPTGPTSTPVVRNVYGTSPPPRGTGSGALSSTLSWNPTRSARTTTLKSLTVRTSTATAWGGIVGASCPTPLPPAATMVLNMVFYSDASVQRKGFHASHKTVCGGVLVAKDTIQRLFSHAKHGDNNYDNKMECEWIVMASKGNRVRFNSDTFEIEDESDCGYDNVEVFDGKTDTSPALGRFCGNKVPNEIISSGQSLLVRFKSDDTINWKGFSAPYHQFGSQSTGADVIKPLPLS